MRKAGRKARRERARFSARWGDKPDLRDGLQLLEDRRVRMQRISQFLERFRARMQRRSGDR